MVLSLGLEGEIVCIDPVRLGVIGCGSHTYRNVLPPFRHIPGAQLVAFCDRNHDKARLFAETCGQSAAWFGSVDDMLNAGQIDAVIVVVGFDDETGNPLYPEVVSPILEKGIPVWMEKPPAADRAGVARMIRAAQSGGTFAQVGFKKVHSPAVNRLKSIISLPSFGKVTRYSYAYDVDLPADIGNLTDPAGRRFLDDFVHVASIVDFLIGIPSLVQVVRNPAGAGIVVNQHAEGAIGSVMLSNTTSGLAPVERLEVVGEGANAVLENGAYLSYFPAGSRGPYGTSTNYLPELEATSDVEHGPRFWEPEFSLGNLHGGSHFVQGYYGQLKEFVSSVRSDTAPQSCSLEAALRIMTYLDALRGRFDEWRAVPDTRPVQFKHETQQQAEFRCPVTGRPLVLKDGWNYVCRTCGKTRSAKQKIPFVCGQNAAVANPN